MFTMKHRNRKWLDQEMKSFADWLQRATGFLIPSFGLGASHLWFVTIHPFDDGAK